MTTKDYYKILGVSKDAGEEEIKKAYRRLALEYHPDRNPGDKEAEERFKNIAEAYGVLMDKENRSNYDRFYPKDTYYNYARANEGFNYNQEDIFRGIFNNPRTRNIFSELEKEFQRQGFRFDKNFFNELFFHGRGIFLGGVFFSGPVRNKIYTFRNIDGNSNRQIARPGFLENIVQKITRKVSNFILTKSSGPAPSKISTVAKRGQDINYSITLSRVEASSGKKIIISYMKGNKPEKLAVKVPPGVKNGTKLKIRGMGLAGTGGSTSGDIYLTVRIQGSGPDKYQK